MARSAMTSDAVQSIIRAQATRAQRLAAADITLFNEGLDLEQLRLAVEAITLNV
jgi:dephospho-CoA kinase